MNTAVLETDSARHALEQLDDPDRWSDFGRPLRDPQAPQESRWESHVVIQGMHCANCALALEMALRAVPGVLEVQVGAVSQRGRIVWSSRLTRPSAWLAAVQRAGFSAVPAQDQMSRSVQHAQSRAALWRWLVAGFCMMQVMMYATPAYLSGPGELDANSAGLLRWASWVLTLPVMLFSARPFFSRAVAELLQRRISMDLPVALGIMLTFIVSSLGTFDPNGIFGQEVYFDSLTMFVFFLLTGRWLEARLRERTVGALDALLNRMPQSVQRLLPDASVERVGPQQLRPGDRIRVLPGEAFPADGKLIEGSGSVDESLLTGESRPLRRSVGDQVIAGSHNLEAALTFRIDRVGQDTRFAEIVELMRLAATTKPRIAVLADRIATPFLLAVLLSAAMAALYWWPVHPGHALAIAAAVLVVTCPCALSLATPATLLAAAGAMARRGVLVRRLDALETLAAVDTVVFDKTGTLTTGTMSLARIHCRQDIAADQALAMAVALAQNSLHPLSRALVQARHPEDRPVWRAEQIVEISGQGLRGTLHRYGDPNSRAQACLGSAVLCSVEPLEVDGPSVYLSDESGWLASFELQESLRPDAKGAVQQLRRAGLRVMLLSGDRAVAVQAVASSCGIEEAQAQCTPSGKLQRITELQGQGHCVAMVGDGLNDGPVLARADVSFSMASAVPLSRAQADLVLMGERLGEVADSLLRARGAMRVVRQNLLWAAVYNAVCVPLAVAGMLPAWLAGLGMAASSLLVVANASRLASVRDASVPRSR